MLLSRDKKMRMIDTPGDGELKALIKKDNIAYLFHNFVAVSYFGDFKI